MVNGRFLFNCAKGIARTLSRPGAWLTRKVADCQASHNASCLVLAAWLALLRMDVPISVP